MVSDLRGVFKALRLYQHHLQLGGGVDVHHLVAPLLRRDLLAAGGLTGFTGFTGLEVGRLAVTAHILLVIVILIVIGMNDLLKFVHQAHGKTLLFLYLV